MKYYNYLDIDHTVAAEKILKYIDTRKEDFKNFWVDLDSAIMFKEIPEIIKMFEPLRITPKNLSIVTTYTDADIHVDYTPYDFRINFPILNCDNTETKFWKSSCPPILKTLPNGINYRAFEESTCELQCSFCLNRAAILRVTEPHSIKIDKKNIPRISATIAFYENIEFLL